MLALEREEMEARIDTGVTVVTGVNLKEPEVQQLLYPTGDKN